MSKPAIIVQDLFKIYSKNANQHLNYGLKDLWGEIRGVKDHNRELREDEFFAVNDISFTLNQGDSIGLIGRNGCGKTTLLKMINGIIKPDKGKILIDGRIQALINLGAGFNGKLSGRENIYTSASLMGLKKIETKAIVDEIIEFAELDDFIDSPVGTYSSGMYARLGFSVAISLKPEILLVDEILSVGDYAFQNKCFTKMHQLKKDGVSIVLVSHSHTQITQLCDYALWMQKGKKVEFGKSKEVVNKYLEFMDQEQVDKVKKLNELKKENKQATYDKAKKRKPTLYGAIYDEFDKIENLSFEIRQNGRSIDSLTIHDPMTIYYSFELKIEVKELNVSINILRKDGLLMTTISTLNGDIIKHIKNGLVSCEVKIESLNLNPGEYVIVMPIHEGHSYMYRNVVKEFVVTKADKMCWGLASFKYEYSVLG